MPTPLRHSPNESVRLDLLVLGHTNVEIPSLLFLSSRKVETHRASDQRKLGVRSRADLVRFALGGRGPAAKIARPEGQRGVS